MINKFVHAVKFLSAHDTFLMSVLRAIPNHSTLKYRCLFRMRHRIRHIYPHIDVEYVGQINKTEDTEEEFWPEICLDNWKSLPWMACYLCPCGEVREKEWFLFINDKRL